MVALLHCALVRENILHHKNNVALVLRSVLKIWWETRRTPAHKANVRSFNSSDTGSEFTVLGWWYLDTGSNVVWQERISQNLMGDTQRLRKNMQHILKTFFWCDLTLSVTTWQDTESWTWEELFSSCLWFKNWSQPNLMNWYDNTSCCASLHL